MELETFEFWNPWWQNRLVPDALKGIKRGIDPLIFSSLEEKEILILTGLRRSGKSTILYQMIDSLLRKNKPSQILYLNLDDEALKQNTLEEIYSFYRQQKNPVEFAYIFLDEIQNKDDWEHFIKKHYDAKEKVKFIISGSSTNLLRGEYATLLTGRNLTFIITPLSFKEYLTFAEISTSVITPEIKNQIIYFLRQYFEFGGFPEIYFKEPELKKIALKNYFEDIIYKDIVKRHQINANKITNLASYLITNIANLFSIQKLRNFTDLSIDSIKDYISYLEEAYLITIVPHFPYSLKETSQLPKKCYVSDCGLRNAVSLRFSQDLGRLAENVVLISLKKKNNEINYWKSKGEVDFVIKMPDQALEAINVSYTDKINSREIESLLEFRKKFNHTKSLIILTSGLEKEEQGIKFIPLWKWLLNN